MLEKIKRIKEKMIEKEVVFNASVDIAIIREFEDELNITLPKELTLFYTEVCNGCSVVGDLYLRVFEKLEFKRGSVCLEFPFKESWIWEWEDTAPNSELLKQIDNGNISVIDLGCGLSWNIIVTGDERGKMWSFSDVGISPSVPRLDFLDWFEHWLDHGVIYTNKPKFEKLI